MEFDTPPYVTKSQCRDALEVRTTYIAAFDVAVQHCEEIAPAKGEKRNIKDTSERVGYWAVRKSLTNRKKETSITDEISMRVVRRLIGNNYVTHSQRSISFLRKFCPWEKLSMASSP